MATRPNVRSVTAGVVVAHAVDRYGRGVRRPGVSSVDPTRVVALGAIAAIVGIQLIFFGLPFGLWLHGLVLGWFERGDGGRHGADLSGQSSRQLRSGRTRNGADGVLGGVHPVLGMAVPRSGWRPGW